jgi:hypothetical protein
MPPRRAAGDTGEQEVKLEGLKLEYMTLRVQGTSPLIVHAWSQKAKKAMLDKQMKRAPKGHDAKDPEQDYQESLYTLEGGGNGFPSVAFKACAVGAGRYMTGFTMVYLRGAFHVEGEMVRIEGDPQPREDMVRVGMGTADIRYRAEFPKWSATLNIVYNARALSAEQLVSLFQMAGFAIGVGEWRPEKDGQFGRFEIEVA